MSESTQTQTIRGTVVKKSSKQTVRVSVKVTKIHPLYKKRYSQLRHFLVHDEADNAEVGSEVTIVACSPISKMKRWKIQA